MSKFQHSIAQGFRVPCTFLKLFKKKFKKQKRRKIGKIKKTKNRKHRLAFENICRLAHRLLRAKMLTRGSAIILQSDFLKRIKNKLTEA